MDEEPTYIEGDIDAWLAEFENEPARLTAWDAFMERQRVRTASATIQAPLPPREPETLDEGWGDCAV